MTPKQERFCQARARGVPVYQAMEEAGYKSTSESNAKRQLANLEKDEKIHDRIKELKAASLIKELDDKRQEKISEAPAPTKSKKMGALDFLSQTYNDPLQDIKIRINAAVAALPYEEMKPAPMGKKEGAIEGAKQATTSGKFATFSKQPVTTATTVQ